jgi:hypothetical protein
MKSVVCFLFLVLCQQVYLQTQVERLTIDNYNEGSNQVLIVLTDPFTLPTSSTSFYAATGGPTSKNILGGERDLQYTAETGSAGRVFSTSVSVVDGEGQWEISTPNGGSGTVLMQYDGVDGTMNLNLNGFAPVDSATAGGIDITEKGKGIAFHLEVVTDIDTAYTFKVYSPDGSVCTAQVTVKGGGVSLDAIVNFSSFTGNCDFNNVGAIELYVDANENVDTITSFFTTVGAPNDGPAPPPPVGGPGFTWYTVDDDFDRYPCGEEPPRRSYFVSNQNIVYYYFYKFDEYVNAYYGSQIIIEISSSPAISYSLFAGLVALLALY